MSVIATRQSCRIELADTYCSQWNNWLLAMRFTSIIFCIWGCLTSTGFTQTSVSGGVGGNSHWTVADSPYIISGNFVVYNNAVLTIDPGVTVYMAEGSGLRVNKGGIQALGTLANPINILSDKTRLAQAAAPGDWNQWVLEPGTLTTRLDHVVFEHGKGLSVIGSAPVFNHLKINNQEGAAITLDLAASPRGVGNQATGNTVNGIAVPAGDIKQDVRWGLRGIPYVISSGTVSVGASPKITSITPNVIQQGATIDVSLSGQRLERLSSVQFDNAGLSAQIKSKTNQYYFGQYHSGALLSITAQANAEVGKSAARLMFDAEEITVADALDVVPTQPILSSLDPSFLYAGQGNVNVTINGTNFTNKSILKINNVVTEAQYESATKMRASIAVPNSSGFLSLKLLTPDPYNEGQHLTSNELSLRVIYGQLDISPGIVALNRGSSKTFTVTLPFTAGADGVILNVVSSNPTIGFVPTTIKIPAGQNTATFTYTPTDAGNTTLTVSKAGFYSAQAQVSIIQPPTLALSANKLVLGLGGTSQVTLKSSVPAGTSGLKVNLSSSDSAIATVPATVTLAAGTDTATFTVTAAANGNATISASADDYEVGHLEFTVREASLNLPINAVVAPGATRTFSLQLSDPAPIGGLSATVTSSNTAVATVPDSIAIAEGQTTATFTVNGLVAGESTIRVTAPNYKAANMPLTVQSLNIGFNYPPVSSILLKQGLTQAYPVTLSSPAPAGGVVVNLTVDNAEIATISPSSITIPEGQTSGGLVEAAITGVAKGSATVNASAEGLGPANIPLNIEAKPSLQLTGLSGDQVTVGKGMRGDYAANVKIANNGPYAGATVSLTSSDPSKLVVPATVTINSYYGNDAWFSVSGIELTQGTPVTVTAEAPGYTPVTIPANVVPASIQISGLDDYRSPAGGQDSFYLGFDLVYHYPLSSIPVDLEIVNANPVGIVDGFYDSANTLSSQASFPEGQSYSYGLSVAEPKTMGTYQVQASAPGMGTATSAVQTVSTPAIRLVGYGDGGSATVGKGMRGDYEAYVQRSVNGYIQRGSNPVTVNLSSSDPSKVGIPATVTIPAGSYHTSIPVTGLDLTNGVPASISATAEGYTNPETPLAVNVVMPEIERISSLDNSRSLSSPRDDFYISLKVPGGNVYPQQPVSDIPINVAMVNVNPAGVVNGVYNAQTGGALMSQAVIPAGQNYTNALYVGTPTNIGTYQVQASLAGGGTQTSAIQTVSSPKLRMVAHSNSGVVSVGKGMQSDYEARVERLLNGNPFTAGNTPVTVSLTSSDPSKLSVPASVTIPSYSYSANFKVTGQQLTNGSQVIINASATGSGYANPDSPLQANVVMPVVDDIIWLDNERGLTSGRDGFYITLAVPGSAFANTQTAVSNMPVNIAVVNANPAGVVDGIYNAGTGGALVSQVTIPAGRYYSNLTTFVGSPKSLGTYQVQAGLAGGAAKTSAVQTVSGPVLNLGYSGGGTHAEIGKGMQSNSVYVQLTGPASAPVEVRLRCTSPVICSVPDSVTIPAGSTLVYVPVKGFAIGGTTIRANADGYSTPPESFVKVVAPKVYFQGLYDPYYGFRTGVGGSLSIYFYVYPYGHLIEPVNFNVTSNAPGIATVSPSVVTLSNGSDGGDIDVNGIAQGVVTINVNSPDFGSATSGVITIE